jgi:hypothetical protein
VLPECSKHHMHGLRRFAFDSGMLYEMLNAVMLFTLEVFIVLVYVILHNVMI